MSAAEPSVLAEVLTPQQVAELLQVPRSSIYGYVRAGRMPCVRLGRHLRFLRRDLDGWLLEQRDPGRPR